MSDRAHDWTDEQIDELVKRFEDVYRQAEREMREKLERSLADYAKENAQRLKALDDTPEAKEAYDDWKRAQIANQAWMQDMVQTLSESAHNANTHAADMVNDALPHVYSENANMSAFALDEQLGYDTGFTLVNDDAVRHLMGLPVQEVGYDQLIREVTWTPEPARSHVQDLRKREVDYPKDMRWNRQKFNSAITQGILQGESIPNIVKRTKSIYGMNKNSAIRAARTATTNAENAGRMSTFERAQRLGIDMEIEWLATLDMRTRDSHRHLDGERIQLGETFSNGLRWPADPLGAPAEIWNCRCRANGRVVGFDGKRGDWADERGKRWTRLPKGMTYEEWKKAKAVSREESYKNPSKVRDGFWSTIQASVGGWASKPVLSNVSGTKPTELDDEITDYYLPSETIDKLPQIMALRTYDDFEHYFADMGITLTTDLDKLLERRFDEINAVRDECQRIAVAINAYNDTFGPDALSKLKRINLYDKDLPNKAAYHFNEIGEDDPWAGTIRFRQWGDDGKTIFHELAHAFQDSHAARGEDAVTYSERMTEQAKLDKSFTAYAGASKDVYEAERFADAFGAGFAKGRKECVEFIESVWVEEVEKKRKAK